ncbi:MAG: hypothetical protein KBI47_10285 [Armatimonadetes bacterium]|nr:hypothetical protein [Armatimonadota bacterium]MDI9584825.1 hypothetical protein [Acidobacteriota bacterium]
MTASREQTMLKCAFRGCGPGAKGHARGYRTVERVQIVAICDLDDKRRNKLDDEFGIDALR